MERDLEADISNINEITPVRSIVWAALDGLMRGNGLRPIMIADGAQIPGSYWGEPEAGLIGNCLYLRGDTPVHSALHEAAHFVCMTAERRASLDTDAGGSDIEENAVCYLQCLMAEQLPDYSMQRCFEDMDAWGYNFALGSAAAWFAGDAEDAVEFLCSRGLLGERP